MVSTYSPLRFDAFFLDLGGLADSLLTPELAADGRVGGGHQRHRQEVGQDHEADVVAETS